jgi:broad specificity phosphatase PhoE
MMRTGPIRNGISDEINPKETGEGFMIKVFLIRHAKPDFPIGERYCLGRAEFPLGPAGRMQSVLLGKKLEGTVDKVYSSSLGRAVETARAIRGDAVVAEGIEEMSAGEWDGYSFSEIKKRWPEIYNARCGASGMSKIPGAEQDEAGLIRFTRGMKKIFEDAEESFPDKEDISIAVVSHATVIQLYISNLMGEPLSTSIKYKPRYASWYELEIRNGVPYAVSGNTDPVISLSDPLCGELMEAAGCGKNIIDHCRAVSCEADRIADRIEEFEIKDVIQTEGIDRESLHFAALLHDVARKQKKHDLAGGVYLRELGYPKLAKIVEQHHDLELKRDEKGRIIIDEAAVLFLADKRIKETSRVGVAERFGKSLEKCRTPEAVEAHERRRRTAVALDELFFAQS